MKKILFSLFLVSCGEIPTVQDYQVSAERVTTLKIPSLGREFYSVGASFCEGGLEANQVYLEERLFANEKFAEKSASGQDAIDATPYSGFPDSTCFQRRIEWKIYYVADESGEAVLKAETTLNELQSTLRQPDFRDLLVIFSNDASNFVARLDRTNGRIGVNLAADGKIYSRRTEYGESKTSVISVALSDDALSAAKVKLEEQKELIKESNGKGASTDEEAANQERISTGIIDSLVNSLPVEKLNILALKQTNETITAAEFGLTDDEATNLFSSFDWPVMQICDSTKCEDVTYMLSGVPTLALTESKEVESGGKAYDMTVSKKWQMNLSTKTFNRSLLQASFASKSDNERVNFYRFSDSVIRKTRYSDWTNIMSADPVKSCLVISANSFDYSDAAALFSLTCN